MRIVAWNLNRSSAAGTDAQVAHLLATWGPDIAVLSEAASTPAVAQPSLLGNGMPYAWAGELPGKGLGILAPRASSLRVIEVEASRARFGLGVHLELDGTPLNVLGIWAASRAADGRSMRYLDAVSQLVEAHTELLSAGAIVAGDFNVSLSGDARLAAFMDDVAERFGLVSAWHAFSTEPLGAESAMTLWWRKKQVDPFHCDYVLLPSTWHLDHVHIPTFDECAGLSDHAPVIVDVTVAA